MCETWRACGFNRKPGCGGSVLANGIVVRRGLWRDFVGGLLVRRSGTVTDLPLYELRRFYRGAQSQASNTPYAVAGASRQNKIGLIAFRCCRGLSDESRQAAAALVLLAWDSMAARRSRGQGLGVPGRRHSKVP